MNDVLRRWWWMPPLALLAIFAWGPALVGPFQFDDLAVVVGDLRVHSVVDWWHSLPGLRPLLKLSYVLNWNASENAFGFHLVNVLIHAANAGLVFAWLSASRVSSSPESTRALPFLVALAWFFHPATTEAVTYISGRSISLMSLWMLAALLVTARDVVGARWWAALFTLLALATRESAWVLPALLFLCVWLQNGGNARQIMRMTLPSFAVVALGAVYFVIEPHHRALLQDVIGSRDAVAQIAAVLGGFVYLAGVVFLWRTPNIDPDFSTYAMSTPLMIFGATVFVSVLAVCIWRVWRYRDGIAGGILFFIIALLPANGFLPRTDVVNDRHLYLPLTGLLLAGFLLLDRFVFLRWPRGGRIVVAMLIVTLASATALRNLDYLDEVALWKRTAQQSPEKARVWNNLGWACQLADDRECALNAYEHAIALDPDDKQAKVNRYFLDR